MSINAFTNLTLDQILQKIDALTEEQRTIGTGVPSGLTKLESAALLAFAWAFHKDGAWTIRAKSEYTPISQIAVRNFGEVLTVQNLRRVATYMHRSGWKVNAKARLYNGVYDILSDTIDISALVVLLKHVFNLDQVKLGVIRTPSDNATELLDISVAVMRERKFPEATFWIIENRLSLSEKQ